LNLKKKKKKFTHFGRCIALARFDRATFRL
jgi:hypothetical protein